MRPMQLKDAVSLLQSNGFTLLRSNGHLIYGCGIVRVVLSHSRIVAPGVVRQVYKAIALVQSQTVRAN